MPTLAPIFNPNATAYNAANALCLAHLSERAYPITSDSPPIPDGFRFVAPLDGDSMAGTVWESDQAAAVAFRGTDLWSLRDWLRDADTSLQGFDTNRDLGKVHRGFVKALRSLEAPLHAALDLASVKGKPLWITGHSLGGAMAVLFAARCTLIEDRPIHGLYTFGQPRVGDTQFARAVEDSSLSKRYFAIINGNDPAPHCPTRRRYADCGTQLQVDAKGRLRGGLSPADRWLQTLIIARRYLQSAGPDAFRAHARTAYRAAMVENIGFVLDP